MAVVAIVPFVQNGHHRIANTRRAKLYQCSFLCQRSGHIARGDENLKHIKEYREQYSPRFVLVFVGARGVQSFILMRRKSAVLIGGALSPISKLNNRYGASIEAGKSGILAAAKKLIHINWRAIKETDLITL